METNTTNMKETRGINKATPNNVDRFPTEDRYLYKVYVSGIGRFFVVASDFNTATEKVNAITENYRGLPQIKSVEVIGGKVFLDDEPTGVYGGADI